MVPPAADPDRPAGGGGKSGAAFLLQPSAASKSSAQRMRLRAITRSMVRRTARERQPLDSAVRPREDRAMVRRTAALALLGPLACGGNPAPAPRLAALSVTPESASISADQTAQLTAAAQDQNGKAMTGVSLAWSSNSPAVTVDPTGLVTGVQPGSARISVSNGAVSASATVA